MNMRIKATIARDILKHSIPVLEFQILYFDLKLAEIGKDFY
jgi:hypothetical protein